MQRRDFLTSLGAISLADTLTGEEGRTELSAAPEKEKKIAADRWLELDLYWFDREHIEQSVAQFLERTFPLYKNVTGWRGVIVCIGWMVDYIAGFDGDLNKRVPLPEFHPAEHFTPQSPHWIIDFPREHVIYPPWTYRDLQRLGEEFRLQARQKYGIADFKFGTPILGWQKIYSSGVTGWRAEHSEAYVESTGALIPGAALRSDHQHYAAYPLRIPGPGDRDSEGIPIRIPKLI